MDAKLINILSHNFIECIVHYFQCSIKTTLLVNIFINNTDFVIFKKCNIRNCVI